jgi:hypothetical protein
MIEIAIEIHRMRGVYKDLPGGDQSFSDFITGRSGKDIRYNSETRQFFVKFENDADAVMFKLSHNGNLAGPTPYNEI